jgi:hypothetical protein
MMPNPQLPASGLQIIGVRNLKKTGYRKARAPVGNAPITGIRIQPPGAAIMLRTLLMANPEKF